MGAFESFMQRIVDVFGYPREALVGAEVYLQSMYSDPDDGDVALLIEQNLSWRTELHDGPSPSEIAFEEDEDRRPEIDRRRVARHFSGLFAYTTLNETPEPPPGNPARAHHLPGFMLIDANDPAWPYVYYSGPSGDSRYWLFPSADESFSYDYLQLRSAFQVKDRARDDARNYLEKSKIMQEKNPRACVFFAKLLGDLGLEAPPPQTFEDEQGERLFRAYDQFLPIADVLRARADGDAGAKLSAEHAKAALQVAKREPAFTPHLLLKLLALGLSGEMAGATAWAKEIQSKGLGVPLTRRWADMVLARAKAFAGG